MLQRVFVIGVLAVAPVLGSGCQRSGCCGDSAAPAGSSQALDGGTAGKSAAGCCAPSSADQPCCEKQPDGSVVVAASTAEKNPKTAEANKADPARQIVFTVEGLTCPAVKGLGCGHRIAPVLARLDKVEGVEKSSANRTGTMLRISVASSADRDKVAEATREILTKDNRKPVLLSGGELKQALAKEEWGSPADLSAIEFRTFALHRVKTFAEAEKLDKEASSKLVKIAEQQWERMAKGGDCCGKVKQPGDWVAQFKQFAASVPDQAKELLVAEQTERLRQVLTKPFEEKDMPIAADGRQKE
jgi:hypothetical protein